MSNAKTIIHALNGKWFGDYGTAKCPAHKDRNPSLSISEKDGTLLVKCHAGCSQQAVIYALRQNGLWETASQSLTVTTTGKSDKSAYIAALWKSSQQMARTGAERYLQGRGINIMPPSLRYHPQVFHGPSKRKHEAMIAGITQWPSKRPHAIHRTFLMAGVKAPIEPNRMMLGRINGGAVRMGNAVDILAIAEGVETALSVQQLTGTPTWAVLSSSNYESLILPDTIKEIQIFADHDKTGLSKAQDAALKWKKSGLKVSIKFPKHHGQDFNDLIIGGLNG